jgi:hypothetical protein
MCENEGYDSRPDTLLHSQRVGELMVQLTSEILERSTCHDRSKTLPPEVGVFDEYTPKLRDTTYGSAEYIAHLQGMGPGLDHHYLVNRHHPEHFPNGINGMTLVDLVEMLADWKAATERHADGDLATSLNIQRARFEIEPQLLGVLHNTAAHFGWLPAQPCGAKTVMAGLNMVCNVPLDGPGWHWGGHADGRFDGGATEWWDGHCRQKPGTHR